MGKVYYIDNGLCKALTAILYKKDRPLTVVYDDTNGDRTRSVTVLQECFSTEAAEKIARLCEISPNEAFGFIEEYLYEHDTDGGSVSGVTSSSSLQEEIPPFAQKFIEELTVKFGLDDDLLQEASETMLQRLESKDFTRSRVPWLDKVAKLVTEYYSLDGLSDAKRASEIPDEILDICQEVLKDDFEKDTICPICGKAK